MDSILGIHITFGAYGFWLPNDPRGSGSTAVWSESLKPFGPATGLADRKQSRARSPHDRSLRLAAKQALKRPAVQFTGLQARAIARGIGEYVSTHGIIVWSFCILPDHLHMVVDPRTLPAHDMYRRVKAAATKRLNLEGLHPFRGETRPDGQHPKCWQRGGWSVYLFDPASVIRTNRYVENNPLKEGKRRQNWGFVTPF